MNPQQLSHENIPAGLSGQGALTSSKKKKKKKSKTTPQAPGNVAQDAPTNSEPLAQSSQQSRGTNSSPNPPSIFQGPQDAPLAYKSHFASLAKFGASVAKMEPDQYFTDEEDGFDVPYAHSASGQPPQGDAPPVAGTGKKKNKKKKKKNHGADAYTGAADSHGPKTNGTSNNPTSKKSNDKIWNTSTNEERERIKEFWLSLGEEDRRSLVKVEKEAVLKKMKEQQKHSCSCSVCGRKRTAIEEELEVLYDAYYEELEQYANQQQSKFVGGVSPLPPHFATRGPPLPSLVPPVGRIEELEDEDEEYEDEYEDEEGEEDEGAEYEPEPENDPRSDFFSFGKSLTVQGGILTVADDLLKNDGKKFIEMMEQLAERRMAKEEEATSMAGGHPNINLPMSSHVTHQSNHPIPPQDYEDEEEEDEEEDEYDEYEDDEEEEEPQDPLTEEQRMEEGRRMFQLFAARMFEQRVLQAYREKVAQERQQKLLEELEEENRLKEEREQRRMREKERKKDRKKLQKQAKEEERQKREAERAAEEAAQRAIEEKKAEETRKRREEMKAKKEAERKAAEEERHRKEEEKKKRQQEEREREAERERKRKENQEKERKKKEEAARKAKEEKEARDKEAREKREREEREKRAKELKAKRQAEEEKVLQEEQQRKAAAAAAANTAATVVASRIQQAQAHHGQNPPPVTHQQLNNLHPPVTTTHLSVANHIGSKQNAGGTVPTRPQQAAQQGPVASPSPKTPQVIPRKGSTASPNTPILQQAAPGTSTALGMNKSLYPPTQFTNPPASSPLIQTSHPFGPPQPGPSQLADLPFGSMPQMGMNGHMPFPGSMPQRPVMGNGMHMYMQQGPILTNPQYRGFINSNGLPMPIPPAPGLRPQPTRAMYMGEMGGPPQPFGSPIPSAGTPLFAAASPFPMGRTDTMPPMQVHGRQHSIGFDDRHMQRSVPPAPIQRPQSTVHKSDDLMNSKAMVDDLSNVLGSRALIDDDGLNVPDVEEHVSPIARRSSSIFGSRPSGMGYRGIFDPIGTPSKDVFSTSPAVDWGPLPLNQSLGSGWTNGAGWSDKDAPRRRRRGETRLDQIRLLACKVCREQSSRGSNFLDRSRVIEAMAAAAPPDLQLPIQLSEIDDLVEVEGDSQNGGGSFVLDKDENDNVLIKFIPGEDSERERVTPAPGEIGSPSIIGSYVSASGFGASSVNIPPMGPPPGIGFGVGSAPTKFGSMSGVGGSTHFG